MEDALNKQRVRIADAFEQHFRHFGFKKTTVDEVALDLGVSKKTIYKCFRSKDDIFYYIISNKAKERRLMIEKKILHLDTAWEKMETMIRINFTEFRKIHKKKPTGINDRFQSEIASAAFREMFISLVWDIIEEGIVKKEFTVCDHNMTVRFIQALIVEAVRVLREDINTEPEDVLICSIHNLLQRKA